MRFPHSVKIMAMKSKRWVKTAGGITSETQLHWQLCSSFSLHGCMGTAAKASLSPCPLPLNPAQHGRVIPTELGTAAAAGALSHAFNNKEL